MTRCLARLFAAFLFTLTGALAARAVETPYVVLDLGSGRVLADRNANQLWYPASVTKLMNAYVTFKAIRSGQVSLATRVVISKNALAEPPSKMGFKVGTAIDLDNAIKMMLVHSSNDIAVAVAETVGGSEAAFVARMNAEAARLGMGSTHFVNPNGLPGPGQYTTARDLAVLGQALWKEFPEWRPIYRITAIKSGKRVLKSANNLLERYPGTLGMKTGFICSSGFNVVALAQRGDRVLLAVVLGMPSALERAELAARLFNDGFEGRGRPGPTLAGLQGNSPAPYVIDMKPEICMKKDRGEHETDDEEQVSALVPKFKLMDPIVVTTLGVVKPDGSIKAAADVADAPAATKGKKAAAKATAEKTEPAKKATKTAKKTKKPAEPAPATDDASLMPASAAGDADAAPPVKASGTKAGKAPAKLEIGVPFDSTEIAPLPEAGGLH